MLFTDLVSVSSPIWEAAEQSFVANLPKKLQYQGVVAVLLQAGFERCIYYMYLNFSCNFQKPVANDCRIIDLFATVAIMKTRKDEHTKTQNKDFKEDYKMERTANNIVKKMEETGILMSRERTFNEYVTEITQFQEMICKIIAGDAYHEGMRLDEALFIMESTARKLNIRSNPAVRNGVMTMKRLEKEMAITMSGAKGENLVSRTLEFLGRPNTRIFRNVYITDGNDETELDAIVLTDGGAIILEVKKVKHDLTLTEDGRMIFSGDECFEKMPLGEKMTLKRRLLKSRLESLVAEKGLDIPIYVDSFIVFSAPKGQYIRIDDRYRREKHCFRTGLNKKIENYLGCAYYKVDQLEQLGEIIAEMETNVKRFETKLNYDEVRRSLAEALAVLQDAQAEQKPAIIEFNTPTQQKKTRIKFSVASSLANFLISGATVLMNIAGESA